MKTCPHCNGPGKLIWNILYCVACTKCGARTEWYDREEDAVRAWERRDGMATGSITHNVVFDTPEATEALVKAMEQAELEAYRKTGLTVSELDEQAYKIQTYNDLLAELKQYQSLGSVEELATIKKYHEISTPEDIKASRRLVELADADKNSQVVQWKEAEDGDGIVCPKCGTDFCTITNEIDKFNHCPYCGVRAKGITKQLPTGVVPREAYEQVAWERDVAIKQLWDDYGVRLGQKKADANGENI